MVAKANTSTVYEDQSQQVRGITRMTAGDLVKRIYGGGTGYSLSLASVGDLGIVKKIDETNGLAYVYWCERQVFLWTKIRKLVVI